MSEGPVWYFNGQFVPAGEVRIPVTDLGVLRGYAVFESLRTYSRRPFRLDAHLDRLWNSAASLELALPWSKAELGGIIGETLERNPKLPDALIRIIITAGPSADGLLPDGAATIAVLVTELHSYAAAQASGIALQTVEYERSNPTAKTTNYARALVALREAQAQGADDALYVDRQGHVLECTNANFFVFEGDRLVTAKEGVLPGITRSAALELARTLFEVEERAIEQAELPTADEAFITSTSRAVVPVVRIDGHVYGEGRPGPHTRRIMQAWQEMVSRLLL